jgi:hypothetical protein
MTQADEKKAIESAYLATLGMMFDVALSECIEWVEVNERTQRGVVDRFKSGIEKARLVRDLLLAEIEGEQK